MNKFILYGIMAMTIGQAAIWFQTNGQFLWESWKKNPALVSLMGWPISFILIYGTRWFYQGMGGLIWPGRLVGFACGIVVFGVLAHHLMGETITPKTLITIALALVIVLIQIFVK